MDLTSIQLQALDSGEVVPIVVEGRNCVLLGTATFESLRDRLDDWSPLTMQRQMAEMMRDDWNDPAMGVYDE
jgi:hypothetical protein